MDGLKSHISFIISYQNDWYAHQSFTTGDLESLYGVDWIVCQLISIMKSFFAMTQIRNSGPVGYCVHNWHIGKPCHTYMIPWPNREALQGTLTMCVIKRNPEPMDASQSSSICSCYRQVEMIYHPGEYWWLPATALREVTNPYDWLYGVIEPPYD